VSRSDRTREGADNGFRRRWRDLRDELFRPVDISFLILFRAVICAAALWTVAELLSDHSIAVDYIRPPFHFTYYFFSWVKPWPGNGMYVHVAAAGLFAAFVGIGFFYRVSAALLFVSLAYIFLLEKALYLNHFYLICLLCFAMVVVPANRRWSVDSLLRPSIRSDFVPAWTLWLLRFHVALPYIFGGLAKLKGDWLRGQPMHSWLSVAPLRFLVGTVVEQQWVALVMSWGAAIFDLSIVPLLLWRRTQKAAFCVAAAFHLTNAFLFNIGVFPWLMIAASLVFFPPDWPRRLWGKTTPVPSLAESQPRPSAGVRNLVVALLLIYASCHVLIPFRHLLYPGNVLWTEEGQLFSWHMMLRTKVTGVQFIAADTSRQKAEIVDVMRWLTPRQFEEMTHDPEMMREFAHFVRRQYQADGTGGVEIHVLALCSLNGRKPQLLVDRAVDLASQPRTLGHKSWIVPLAEPFRWDAWDVPVAEWHRYVITDLPQK
jgi:hypothetical protein